MKTSLLALFLLFSCLVLTLGYAAITQELEYGGTILVGPPPKGLFIVDVEVVAAEEVVDAATSYSSPTNLHSAVNSARGGSITYKITVENTSDVTYWYRGVSYLSDLPDTDNDLLGSASGITVVTKDKLSDTTATFNHEDWVPPKTTRVFYAIYTFGSDAVGLPVTTIVNFSFGGQLTSYGDDFLALLNDPARYSALVAEFNKRYAASGTTVLSNLGADAAFFDSLFGFELMLDGKPVKLMIERANVDGKTTGDSYFPVGPTACEYTLYLTTEDLSGTPTVHAVSYTWGADGVWVQIGELYEGTTPLGTYKDSNGNVHTAMNIDSWVAATKTYTVFTYKGSSVTYKVNERYGNSFQQQYLLDDLMSMVDQELYNQLNNHQILKDTYQILFVEYIGSDAPEILLLREAYEDALRYYEMHNTGQQFTLDNKATRAELLSTVEALARAMEYYLQVHESEH